MNTPTAADSTPPQGGKQAGLVLAIVGAFTYGSTSIYALVLAWEWLRDPRRAVTSRPLDLTAFLLAVPGSLYFAYFSLAMFGYSPGGMGFGVLVAANWLSWLIFVVARRRRIFGAVNPPAEQPPFDEDEAPPAVGPKQRRQG